MWCGDEVWHRVKVHFFCLNKKTGISWHDLTAIISFHFERENHVQQKVFCWCKYVWLPYPWNKPKIGPWNGLWFWKEQKVAEVWELHHVIAIHDKPNWFMPKTNYFVNYTMKMTASSCQFLMKWNLVVSCSRHSFSKLPVFVMLRDNYATHLSLSCQGPVLAIFRALLIAVVVGNLHYRCLVAPFANSQVPFMSPLKFLHHFLQKIVLYLTVTLSGVGQ